MDARVYPRGGSEYVDAGAKCGHKDARSDEVRHA
jgi:hypothetical protein